MRYPFMHALHMTNVICSSLGAKNVLPCAHSVTGVLLLTDDQGQLPCLNSDSSSCLLVSWPKVLEVTKWQLQLLLNVEFNEMFPLVVSGPFDSENLVWQG
jgi:hypothetical protein